jgi:hypothetical protein
VVRARRDPTRASAPITACQKRWAATGDRLRSVCQSHWAAAGSPAV